MWSSARRAVVIALVLVALVGATVPAPAGADPAPPPRPPQGELGGAGPCTEGTTRSSFGRKGAYVWVHQPAGTATPRTGGRCDDADRPVIFIAPGYGAMTPSSYRDLIDDMVSNGYIVVYVNYTLLFTPALVYPQVIDGYEVAATTIDGRIGGRMDLANLGIWGHSYGAGMVPWLAQEVAARGWGAESLWLSSNATSWVFRVPLTGPLDIPDHARVHVVAYDQDEWVDHRVGFDIFHAYDVPYAQKDHIQIQSDRGVVAHHKLPGTDQGAPDHLDWYGTHRQYQALADCARTGSGCDADLTSMGTWSDGQPATPAIVSDDPVDMGPSPARVECGESSGSGTPSRCGP